MGFVETLSPQTSPNDPLKCPFEGKGYRPKICPNNVMRPETRDFASSSICQTCPKDNMAGNTLFAEVVFRKG